MLKYYDEIENEPKIDIYYEGKIEKYTIPNSYYINNLGLLYNCFGKDGHKEANLKYAYNLIKDDFYSKKYITLSQNKTMSMEEILKREINNLKRIISFGSINNMDVMNYLHLNCVDINDSLLMKLIIGIITSKTNLLKKFIELKHNSSNAIKELEKIIEESNDDLNDILVRYVGFHKINSTVDKTITTSSLDLYSFKEYFDKGYSIDVVPKILSNENEEYRNLIINKFLYKYPEYKYKVKVR